RSSGSRSMTATRSSWCVTPAASCCGSTASPRAHGSPSSSGPVPPSAPTTCSKPSASTAICGRSGPAPCSRYPVLPVAQQLGSFEKVLRVGEGRRGKRLQQQAQYIGTLESEFEQLSDAELAAKTIEFKQRLERGEHLDEILFEA